MKKTKKYLVVIKHYTVRKREPDLELIALCDTEEEALKLCRKQYSDYIEVWAENWPQDPINHGVLLHRGHHSCKRYNRELFNWVENWIKDHKK